MKWIYSIKNKLMASGVLFLLCLLVLLSHYLDRIHTQNVTNSISTLYEDRLIAEDYILKMTTKVYQIREVLHKDDQSTSKGSTIDGLLRDFNYWYEAYKRTRLTKSEEKSASALISHVKDLEQEFSGNNFAPSDYTEKALVSLNRLSNVQLAESKLIMKNAESEYANIKASAQFAFAIIIVILLVLQALVFASKSIVPVHKPKDPMLN